MTKNKKSSHYSLRCMMNNRRLNKTKRRSICSNLPVKTILLATMLFFFAISRTTTTVDSFIPRANNHRSTKKSIAGHAKHSPLPTSTSLGYEDDKSFDTNVDSPSPVPRKDASSATVVTERKEKSSCPFLPSVKKSESPSKARVNIRYRGTWYDVTNFRKAHSAGPHWLDWFDGRDATEIIDGLHSTHSRKMATRLPKVKPEVSAELEAKAAPDSKVQLNFRQLFDQMLRDGWWERNMHFEYQQLGIWASLVLGAAATVQVAPYISFVLLALSFTGAGWLGHDYVHGLDPFAKSLRLFLPLTTGLSPRWWSDKHNKHHALTNEIGVDEDMVTDPILYTWAPDPSQDSVMRKVQHYIFWIPFMFLFFVWRLDSLVAAVHAVDLERPAAKKELCAVLAHYAILFTLFPVYIWLPSFLLSGLISSLVVTATHQSEEKFTEYQPDYVTRQFLCTRSVVMSNPLSAWIWGGMQYQIEHHLFPSLPRSKLRLLKPIIQQFAKDNNIEGGYRESGEFEILKMNWKTYQATAVADPVIGAPLTTGKPGQKAAIAEGFTAAKPFYNEKMPL